ncbi:MAG TPA: 2-hydroxyacid dehydrogenase [Vicinamibacterales bacterium]|nr:2-hydroxyacid dehydrogenase [Vicinamibacterales bacterium]
MRIAFFSTHSFDRQFFDAANRSHGHDLRYLEARLTPATTALAAGAEAVCAFVNDDLHADVLTALHAVGVRLIALRSAGFNHVDLPRAFELGLTVARVPAYSPYAVAEHAVAMMLSLNRKIHRAHARVREGNFALDGLLGFDMRGRTVGLVGTGKIGTVMARILTGFGCRLLAYDVAVNPECADMGVHYRSLDELWAQSDIVSLHAPLTGDTRHMIDAAAIARMKPGVMIVNTSRGALVDTGALIDGLKSGHVGSVGLDVYEEEEQLFFRDLSAQVIQDDVFARLLTFPNVLITAHQGFFTREAMTAISEVTLENVSAFEQDRRTGNELQ